MSDINPQKSLQTHYKIYDTYEKIPSRKTRDFVVYFGVIATPYSTAVSSTPS